MSTNNVKPPLHCIFCGKKESDDLRFIQANLQNEAINFREVKNIVKVIQHEE